MFHILLRYSRILKLIQLFLFWPPEWRSGLRHCIAVLEALEPGSLISRAGQHPATTRRPIRWCTICPAWLGEGFAGRDVLVPSRSSDSCGGLGACTLAWVPVVQCFLWHIGVPGFHAQQTVCQEAVRLGRVLDPWHGSRPLPLPSLYGICSDVTRL